MLLLRFFRSVNLLVVVIRFKVIIMVSALMEAFLLALDLDCAICRSVLPHWRDLSRSLMIFVIYSFVRGLLFARCWMGGTPLLRILYSHSSLLLHLLLASANGYH